MKIEPRAINKKIVTRLPSIALSNIKNPTFILKLKKLVSSEITFEVFGITMSAMMTLSISAIKNEFLFMLIVY